MQLTYMTAALRTYFHFDFITINVMGSITQFVFGGVIDVRQTAEACNIGARQCDFLTWKK